MGAAGAAGSPGGRRAPARRAPRSPRAYARLGSEVLLLEALERLLPGEDADISKLVERGLKRQGIAVHTGTPIEAVQADKSSVSFGYGGESAEVDYLVICAGRRADVPALGLDAAGVELRRQRPRARSTARSAPRAPASMRSAISCTAPRWRTRRPTRASSPPRTRPACRPTRSPTWTSRARRSACRTSARSA